MATTLFVYGTTTPEQQKLAASLTKDSPDSQRAQFLEQKVPNSSSFCPRGFFSIGARARMDSVIGAFTKTHIRLHD